MARFRNDIDAEITGLEDRLARLYAERQNAAARPTEPGDGSVIKFSVQYANLGPVYRYVCYRIGNRWYHTRGTTNMSWREVVDLIRKDISIQEGARKFSFQIAEKWKNVE